MYQNFFDATFFGLDVLELHFPVRVSKEEGEIQTLW